MSTVRTPPPAAMRAAKIALRFLVSASILALILRTIDLGRAGRVLENASAGWLLVALLLQFGSTAVSVFRWQLVMRNLGFGQSPAFYWSSYFKAMFFNQGLPTSVGGDALRVLDVAARGFRRRDALAAVVIDRLIGLAALLLLAFAAHLVDPSLLPAPVYRSIVWMLAAALAGFVALAFAGRLHWLRHRPRLKLVVAVSNRLRQSLSAQRFLLCAASLLVPLLAMLGFFAAGRALGLRYDLLTYFAIVPPALVLTVVPVSIAGWGVREGALVALFSLIGADKTAVLMMSLAYGMMLVVVSLPGLVVFLRGRR